MWKQLTWFYVIKRPGLATQQHGQRLIVRNLYEAHCKAALEDSDLTIFPAGFREAIEQALAAKTDDAPAQVRRIIVDYIAGMTESQAVSLYRRLTGVSFGSILDYSGR